MRKYVGKYNGKGRFGKPNWREEDPKCPEYYKKRNPDWTDEQCQQAKTQYCRSINTNCIEYYQEQYPDKTAEEHQQMLKEHMIQKTKKRKTNIEYYRVNFPDLSPEEQEKMRAEYAASKNVCCIEYYRTHYPDLSPEEQEKMLKEKIAIRSSHQPDHHGENNPHHRSRTTELHRKQTSPMCLEFYQLRYPDKTEEEQIEMWQKHKEWRRSISKDRRNSCRCIERWLSLGYSEEEARQKVTEVQNTFNLEKCISKYGEEEGIKRFQARQEKWKKSLREHFEKEGDKRSPQSRFANDMIESICKILDIEIPTRETYLTDKRDQKHYAYDFTYGKKMIEFNGDYWHCNPRIYGPDYFNKVGQMTAKEKWEIDKRKCECANNYGYEVLTVWERDYNDNKQEVLSKCVEFLTK